MTMTNLILLTLACYTGAAGLIWACAAFDAYFDKVQDRGLGAGYIVALTGVSGGLLFLYAITGTVWLIRGQDAFGEVLK